MATILNAKTTGVGGVDFQGDSSGVLEFQTGGTAALTINTSQNIGIGTTPSVKLDVYDATSSVLSVDGDSNTSIRSTRYSTDATAPALNFRKARGTKASPTTVATSDFTTNLQSFAYDGTTFRVTSTISSQVETYTTTDNLSGNLIFSTRPTGVAASTLERMRIDSSGNVGIGTSSPQAKLQVSTNAVIGGSTTGASQIALNTGGGSLTKFIELYYVSGSPSSSTTDYGRIQAGYQGSYWSNLVLNPDGGNVGIGTTAPLSRLNSVASNAAAVTALTLNNSNTGFAADEAVDIDFGVGSSVVAAHGKLRVANTTATSGSNSYMSFYTRASDVLAEKMRIDSSGNVGIGTTSPAYQLSQLTTSRTRHVLQGATANTGTQGADTTWFDGTTAHSIGFQQSIFGTGGSTFTMNAGNSQAINFVTSNAERMRIDSSGRVAIGTNTPDGSSALTISKGSDIPLFVASTGTNDGIWITLNSLGTSGQSVYAIPVRTAGALRGGIQWNGTNLLYNNLSDERLKDNITDSSSGLDKLKNIKVRSYDWKESGQHVDFGVIAQELEEIAPEAVSKGKDNEDGSINIPYAVDTSVLVPAMIKAIQEQQTIINDLKARIETLETK